AYDLGLVVSYRLSPRFDLGAAVTGGGLAADRAFERVHGGVDMLIRYTVLPNSNLTPFLTAGAGALLLHDSDGDPDESIIPTLGAGAGLEMRVTPQTGVSLSLVHTYTLLDALDDAVQGRYNDNVWGLHTGVTFYFR